MSTTVINLTRYQLEEVLQVVKDLRRQGLVQGQDFDYAWQPRRWDEMVGDVPSSVEFRFYNSQLATWFSLRWA
jgi:hypothetical protein